MSKIRALLAAMVAVAAGISMPVNVALADTEAYKQLSGEWWQWALSIPADDNPLTDETGANCMVGQRGSNWFLAGTFGASPVIRTCSIPENVTLFFPVINNVNFDTPNACGQDSTPLPSQYYRGLAAAFIDGASNLSVSVDGNSVKQLHRVQSKVFWLALPEDNLFAAACASFGGLPAGIYSPAVDDGIYVELNPLAVGSHTLQFHAENSGAGFVQEVTYNLVVVPVVQK